MLPVAAHAQVGVDGAIALHVTESSGIRRFGYPVQARVPFAAGALHDASTVRLLSGRDEVPAQYTVDTRWPDGSVQWLDIDFSASIGPDETTTYAVEHGPGVRVTSDVPRGLTVTEDADLIRVGRIALGTTGRALIRSVTSRGEVVGAGSNGVAVTDRTGRLVDVGALESLTAEIVKPGPVYVEVRYTGQIEVDAAYRPRVTMTVGLPNSKSWIRVETVVEDPERRLSGISFHTPLALGPLPWVWDFGTPRWTYGSLRGETDAVVLTHTVDRSDEATWTVETGEPGRVEMYETARGSGADVAGWGHLEGGSEVVAFALADTGREAGAYRLALDGGGQLSLGFTALAPRDTLRLTVYEHYVSTPVQIGAATSPASMLSPLVAACDLAHYTASGLTPPPEARRR